MEMMEQYSTNLTSSIAETVKKAVEDATRNLAIETSTSTHQPESQATNATATGGVQIGRWREYSGFAVPADFKFPSVFRDTTASVGILPTWIPFESIQKQ